MRAAAAVVILGPVLANIIFWLSVDRFVPSLFLESTGYVISVISALVWLLVILRGSLEELREHVAKRAVKKAAATAALWCFAPLGGFVMSYAFFSGPVSYALHHANVRPVQTLRHEVVRADTLGSKACRKRAVLEGDRLLWKRQVCGVSDRAIQALASGGSIFLEAGVSPYGLTVYGYALHEEPANR